MSILLFDWLLSAITKYYHGTCKMYFSVNENTLSISPKNNENILIKITTTFVYIFFKLHVSSFASVLFIYWSLSVLFLKRLLCVLSAHCNRYYKESPTTTKRIIIKRFKNICSSIFDYLILNVFIKSIGISSWHCFTCKSQE